jgi:hypothetical protein
VIDPSLRTRRAMHDILVHKRISARDIDLVMDSIPHTAPPPPAVGEWPPGDAMRGWLNVVLDVEMRAEVERYFSKLEETISRANREAPFDLQEVRELLAVAWASDGQGDGPLRELLRDPAETPSMVVREYIARRSERRPAHRPAKSIAERRAKNFNWRAYVDARRLRRLLVEMYPRAPRRSSRWQSSVAGIADEVAAPRWGISVETLRDFAERSKMDRRRLDP